MVSGLSQTGNLRIAPAQSTKFQAGDRVWHLNFNEPAVQNYIPGPSLVPGVWFEYEIIVQGDDYTVFLTNSQSGQRTQTTSFHNTDVDRGLSRPAASASSPIQAVRWHGVTYGLEPDTCRVLTQRRRYECCAAGWLKACNPQRR